jgi:hypothetical protein
MCQCVYDLQVLQELILKNMLSENLGEIWKIMI